MKGIIRIQSPFVDVIELEGVGQIDTAKAVEVAANLVFLARGDMVKAMNHRAVLRWNLDAEFFTHYAALMGKNNNYSRGKR